MKVKYNNDPVILKLNNMNYQNLSDKEKKDILSFKSKNLLSINKYKNLNYLNSNTFNNTSDEPKKLLVKNENKIHLPLKYSKINDYPSQLISKSTSKNIVKKFFIRKFFLFFIKKKQKNLYYKKKPQNTADDFRINGEFFKQFLDHYEKRANDNITTSTNGKNINNEINSIQNNKEYQNLNEKERNKNYEDLLR